MYITEFEPNKNLHQLILSLIFGPYNYSPSVAVKIEAVNSNRKIFVIVAEYGTVDNKGSPSWIEIVFNNLCLAHRCETKRKLNQDNT